MLKAKKDVKMSLLNFYLLSWGTRDLNFSWVFRGNFLRGTLIFSGRCTKHGPGFWKFLKKKRKREKKRKERKKEERKGERGICGDYFRWSIKKLKQQSVVIRISRSTIYSKLNSVHPKHTSKNIFLNESKF